MAKKVLSGLTKEELTAFIKELGEPAFRAEQLHQWLYVKNAGSFEEMTNLSKAFREILTEKTLISETKIIKRQESSDGTLKYLLEFADGERIETVLMRFDNRPNLTACVSTQVGCSVNCLFCATGKRGLIRNLSVSEIVEQILVIQRDTGLKVSNIVFMGQGEPFLNYTNLSKAIKLLNESLEIGSRRMTVSTAGIIPKIRPFGKDFPQCTLAVSLHAPNTAIRKKLLPLEEKYPIEQLIKELQAYVKDTNRRVTIEYVLLKGINDDLNHAKYLNQTLKDLHCNINLIPYNKIDDADTLDSPAEKHVKMFKYILELSGKKVTVRLKRGNDIDAACGQLSGKCEK